ncbi:Spo0E like sporulation regulatory protein [Paenibacillus sp. NFR01]|nr:Spo0E like sporulation regulatory protein [Paenibacillus sp. NFR01]
MPGTDGLSSSSARPLKIEPCEHRVSLEDEIRLLRRQMEMLFIQEKSFTSKPVVEASTRLDLKLNEYMKVRFAGN